MLFPVCDIESRTDYHAKPSFFLFVGHCLEIFEGKLKFRSCHNFPKDAQRSHSGFMKSINVSYL